MDLNPDILLELQYLPPVQYFTKFLLHDTVHIEQWENYQKGSYRNRCLIAGPNGTLRLSIPLVSGKHQQTPIREVAIAYREPWQHQHWHSIQTAYGNSPFFEFYSDAIRPFYETRYTRLFDFNRELLVQILNLLNLPATLVWSEHFQPPGCSPVLDFRGTISPKDREAKNDPYFHARPYRQVFEEKTGFLANLSILDLLFCAGPQATMVLEASIINT